MIHIQWGEGKWVQHSSPLALAYCYYHDYYYY